MYSIKTGNFFHSEAFLGTIYPGYDLSSIAYEDSCMKIPHFVCEAGHIV